MTCAAALIAVAGARALPAAARAPARQLLDQPPRRACRLARPRATCTTSSTRPRSRPSRSAACRRATVLAPQARRGRRAALTLTVDGAPRARCAAPAGTIALPPGQGGLKTTRVELDLRAPRARAARVVRCATTTFPGRVGWKAIVAAPGDGHRGALDVPAATRRTACAATRRALLQSPADERAATLRASRPARAP